MSEEHILNALSVDNVRAHVEHIVTQMPTRLAGSENARRMAEYSCEEFAGWVLPWAGFDAFYAKAGANLSGGLRDFEEAWLAGLSGPELLTIWWTFCRETADHFRAADPGLRVRWAGPSMSARSSITARWMS